MTSPESQPAAPPVTEHLAHWALGCLRDGAFNEIIAPKSIESFALELDQATTVRTQGRLAVQLRLTDESTVPETGELPDWMAVMYCYAPTEDAGLTIVSETIFQPTNYKDELAKLIDSTDTTIISLGWDDINWGLLKPQILAFRNN